MVVIILVFIILGLLAAASLVRSRDGSAERDQTIARLNLAAQALEQYAASAQRLPCPANPVTDTGDEVATGATCTHDAGTVPWKTIGLRHDDAFDAWARKISYRVYTGNKGSLTQAGGVSMVQCDVVEPTPGGTTGAGSAGGMCRTNPDPYLRDTLPAEYLQNKGLTLNDSGTAHTDAAYVLISHGVTGLGGYTISGAKLSNVAIGDETSHTQATGPFRIRAFSDSDTSATANGHFDDLLVYRRLPELVKRIGLEARDWPELGATSTSITFDTPTLTTALGTAPSPGDTGRNTFNVGTTNISGFTGTSTATNLSFETLGGAGGIGVFGNGNLVTSGGAGEFIRIDLLDGARYFGLTLNDFGTYTDAGGNGFTEKVELRFYSLGALVGAPIVKSGCRTDGGLASFVAITPGLTFNRVELRALPATSPTASSGATGFLLSAIQACPSSGLCVTSLTTPGNLCP